MNSPMKNFDPLEICLKCLGSLAFSLVAFSMIRDTLSSYDLSCHRSESSQVNCKYEVSSFFGLEQDSPVYVPGVLNTIIVPVTVRGGDATYYEHKLLIFNTSDKILPLDPEDSTNKEISIQINEFLKSQRTTNVFFPPENPTDSEEISIQINEFLKSQRTTLEITWNNYWCWVFPFLFLFSLTLLVLFIACFGELLFIFSERMNRK